MTATNSRTPYIPRFETVNVPPESSGGVIDPSRTRAASARVSARDLAQRLAVGVEHRRDHERVLRGDRDADVHALVELEPPVAVAAVRARELLQRQRAGLHDQMSLSDGTTSPSPAAALIAARSIDRLLHVDVGLQREVGDGRPRLGHPPRDHLLRPRSSSTRTSPLAVAGAGLGEREPCGRRRREPAFRGSGRARRPPAAASTSAFTIRPPGPVPVSDARFDAAPREPSAAPPAKP